MNSSVAAFAKSTAKVALALFLAFVAIGMLAAAYSWWESAAEGRKAKPFEVVREWPVDLKDNLSITLDARSKVVSRKLLVAVRVNGHPEYLSAPRNREASITLHFLDNDAFKVHSKVIPISEFSAVVGPDGKKVGLRTQFEDHIDLDTYSRFSRLVVEWTLDPKSQDQPKLQNAPVLLDHCAPNLTRSERLKRLAQHGTVRQTGTGAYAAGDHTVNFFEDGSLLHCG